MMPIMHFKFFCHRQDKDIEGTYTAKVDQPKKKNNFSFLIEVSFATDLETVPQIVWISGTMSLVQLF